MVKVKISEHIYEATVRGRLHNPEWDGRDTKAIMFDGNVDFETASAEFIEGASWGIITESTQIVIDPETGEEHEEVIEEEFDNSDYSVAGAVTDYRDGRVSVIMGKLTDVEEILEDIYGGEF